MFPMPLTVPEKYAVSQVLERGQNTQHTLSKVYRSNPVNLVKLRSMKRRENIPQDTVDALETLS